jgi:predicted nucleic-acid-binding protein
VIALDTNVVVRFLVQDDESQARASRELMAGLTSGRPGFLSDVVLAETFWVLTRAYGVDRAAAVGHLEALVSAPAIAVESPRVVQAACDAARGGADFPDALIDAVAHQHGCTEVVTFDKRAGATLQWRVVP